MILRYFSGYRLDHVFNLTIKQFQRLSKEAYALQAYETILFSTGVRNAHHSKDEDYQNYHNTLEKVVKSLRSSNNKESEEEEDVKTYKESDIDEFFNKE